MEINNLIELTQSYLNNKTNQYEDKWRNYVEEREKSTPEELFPKSQQESFLINDTENKQEHLDQNLSANSDGFYNIVPGFSSVSSIHASPIHFQEVIDYDELFKLTFATSKKRKEIFREWSPNIVLHVT